jgi:hypothetical protein
VEGYVTALSDLFDLIPLDEPGSQWVNLGDKHRGGARLALDRQCGVGQGDRATGRHRSWQLHARTGERPAQRECLGIAIPLFPEPRPVDG